MAQLQLADGRLVNEQDVVWLPLWNHGLSSRLANYADHAKELAFKATEEPLAFLKGPNTFIGHRGTDKAAC